MAHYVLIGIEHLMTGLLLRSENGDVITFERESPSVIRASCDSKIDCYWQPKQAWMESTEGETEHVKYSSGEAEFYAQRVAPALVDIDNRSAFDMQTYTRRADYIGADGLSSRYAPGEPTPFPWAVVKAMRRKHGKDADTYLAKLRWDQDHWFYIDNSMYIGVEPDGYIHT